MAFTINGLPEQELKGNGLRHTVCAVSLCRFVSILLALATITSLVYFCKAYLKVVLLWLDNQNPFIISATIMVLFFIVALPISIGYIVLVIASGYFFGIVKGAGLVIIGANFGLFLAHNVLKLLGHHERVYSLTQNNTSQAIMRVIRGPHCFKIVMCSRLTPIPFGLQNTIFALSNVNGKIYHLASMIGLFPAQMVGLYVGSTLRSMQDVLENRPMSSRTYLFVFLQILLGASFLFWVGTKARKELLKALAEADDNSSTSTTYSIV